MSRNIKKKIIEFKNVSFGYGKDLILENISFVIKEGEYWGLVGPNGAGKTTLIKILLGFLSPQKGTVKIFGKDLPILQQYNYIGYVPQRSSQVIYNFPISVEEMVKTGLISKRGLWTPYSKNDYQKIEDILEILQLNNIKKKSIRFLSGGQRQKVFLARALVSDPKILILDEPSTGVDIASQESFYKLIKKLHIKMNLTILLVSHDIDIITKEVEQVLCLNKNLMCKVPIQDFVKGEYIEKLYGRNIKIIHHHHKN